MAEDKVEYDVTLGADSSNLEKSINSVIKAMEGLESSISKSATQYQKAFDKMGDSAQRSGQKASNSLKNSTKNISPSIGKLEDLQSSYQKVFNQAQKLGRTEGVDKAKRSMNAYNKQLRSGFESSSQMNEATSRLKSELKEVERESNRYQQTMLKMEKSIGSAERQVETITSRMRAMGKTEQEITPLNTALEQYRQDIRAAGDDTVAQTRASENYKNSLNRVTSQTSSSSQSTEDFAGNLNNATKAVQLALGPLSGIAARISAFNSLVKSNTVSVAAFTASLVGLVVATGEVVSVGVEYERQLLIMESAINATGRAAETTVEDLDALSRSIAAATLTSSTEARNAISVLSTFSNITTESFESVLLAAQGVATVFGGTLQSNARLLGRALDQPSSSLDRLRRVGIQFSDSQKDLIKSFEQVGRLGKAQSVIMDRLAVFQEAAQKEAEGLAGQIDALSDNFQTLTEEISKETQTNELLTSAYKEVNDVIKEVTANTDQIAKIIDGLGFIVKGVTAAIRLFADNIRFFATVAAGVFAAAVLKSVALLGKFLFVNRALLAVFPKLIGGFSSTAAATTSYAGAAATASVATRGLMASFGPLSLVLTAMSATFYLLSGSTDESASSSEKLQEAHAVLSVQNGRTERSMNSLANATGKVTEEMVQQAQVVEAEYQAELEKALKGAEVAFDNYLDAVEKKSEDTTRIVPGDSFGLAYEADPEVTMFGNALEKLFSKIKEGGDVSRESIKSLQDEADNLGIDIDLEGFIIPLVNLQDEAEGASSSLKRLQEILAEDSFSGEAFLKGLQDNLSDVVYDFDQLDKRLTNTAFLNAIEGNATDAAKSLSGKFSPAIKDVLENLNKGNISQEEANKRIGYYTNEADRAVNSTLNLAQALSDQRMEGFNETLQDISLELDLASASSEEAREEIEMLAGVSDSLKGVGTEFSGIAHAAASATEGGVKDLKNAMVQMNVQSVRAGNGVLFTAASMQALSSSSDAESVIEALTEKYEELLEVTARSTLQSERQSEANKEARKEQEKREKSVGKMADTFKGLIQEANNAEAALNALENGGLKSLDKSLKDAGVAEEVQKIASEMEKLDEVGKQEAINKLNDLLPEITVNSENYKQVLEELVEGKLADEDATKRQKEAMESLQSTFKDIVEESKKIEESVAALSKPFITASNLNTIREAEEEFGNLNDQAKQNYIADLRKEFPQFAIDAENLGESLEKVFSQQNVQRDWADTWEKASKDVGNALETNIKGALDGSIDNFSDAADSLKDLMKQLLIDLAYQAAIEPIVVGIQADVMGALTGGRSGGFSNTLSGISDVAGMFSKGSGSGLGGMAGGLTNTAILAANSVTGGAAGAALGGMSGGLSSAAITSANTVAGGSAAASGGFMSSVGSAAPYIAAGLFVDELLGLGIADGLSKGISNLFGGGNKNPVLDLSTSEDSSSVNGREFFQGQDEGIVSSGAFGDIGFLKDSSKRIVKAFDGLKNAEAFLDSVATLDDSVASLAKDAEQLTNMTDIAQKFDFKTAGDASGISDQLFDRYAAIISETDSRLAENVSVVTEDILENVIKDRGGRGSGVTYGAEIVGQRITAQVEGGLLNEMSKLKPQDAINALVSTIRMERIGNAIGGAVTDDLYDSLEGLSQNALVEEIASLEEAFVAIQSLDDASNSMNIQFNAASQGALDAASSIATFAGGVGNLSALQSSYYENFFSDAEKFRNLNRDVSESFAALNVEMPKTREGFRDLVEAQELNTESGAEMYVSLLQLQGVFDSLITSSEKAGQGVSKAFESIQQTLNPESFREQQIRDTEKILGFDKESGMSLDDIANMSMGELETTFDELGISAKKGAEAVSILNDANNEATEDAYSRLEKSISDEKEALQKSYDDKTESLEKQLSDEKEAYDNFYGERVSLENQLLSLIGDTDTLRQRELDSMDDSNKELQRRIWTIEDETEAAEKSRAALQGVFDSLESSLESMIEDSRDLEKSRKKGQNTLNDILRSGDFSDPDRLDRALRAVSEPSEGLFGTFVDYQKDFLKTANTVSTLKDEAKAQLTTEQHILDTIGNNHKQDIMNWIAETKQRKEQFEASQERLNTQMNREEIRFEQEMKRLDEMLESYRDQIDAINGVDISVQSVESAVKSMKGAISGLGSSIASTAAPTNPPQVTTSSPSTPKNDPSDLVTAIGNNTGTLFRADLFTRAYVENSDLFSLAPGFAKGGMHSGGLRIVGENGPELEATGASRIFSNRQSAKMLNDDRLVNELREVKAELREIKATSYQTTVNTHNTSKDLRRWEYDGLPETRK